MNDVDGTVIGFGSPRFDVTPGQTYTVTADINLIEGIPVAIYVRTYDKDPLRTSNELKLDSFGESCYVKTQ